MEDKKKLVALIGVIVLYDFLQYLANRRPLGLGKRLGMYFGYLCVILVNLGARYNAIGTLMPSKQHPLDNVIAAHYPDDSTPRAERRREVLRLLGR